MTQEKGIPYQRHKPPAELRAFLDPLDPGSYFDCGRARLHGLDDALLREAESRGRQIGDDSFQLVATDMGLIFCRPSISFAIAARWEDVMLIRPHGDDPVVLPVTWPTHGELKFTVSKRLAGNIFRRWLQLRMQAARLARQNDNTPGAPASVAAGSPADREMADGPVEADAAPTEADVADGTDVSVPDPDRRSESDAAAAVADGPASADQAVEADRSADATADDAGQPGTDGADATPDGDTFDSGTADGGTPDGGTPDGGTPDGGTDTAHADSANAEGDVTVSDSPDSGIADADTTIADTDTAEAEVSDSVDGPAGIGVFAVEDVAGVAVGVAKDSAEDDAVVGSESGESLGLDTQESDGADDDRSDPPVIDHDPSPEIDLRTDPDPAAGDDEWEVVDKVDPPPASDGSLDRDESGLRDRRDAAPPPRRRRQLDDDGATRRRSQRSPVLVEAEHDLFLDETRPPPMSDSGSADPVSGDGNSDTAAAEPDYSWPQPLRKNGRASDGQASQPKDAKAAEVHDRQDQASDHDVADGPAPLDNADGVADDSGPTADGDSEPAAAGSSARPRVGDDGPSARRSDSREPSDRPSEEDHRADSESDPNFASASDSDSDSDSDDRRADRLDGSLLRTIEKPVAMEPSWVGSPLSLVATVMAVSSLVLILTLAVSSYRRAVGPDDQAVAAGVAPDSTRTTVDHQRFRPDRESGEPIRSAALNPADDVEPAGPAATGPATGTTVMADQESVAVLDEPRLCNSNYSGCVPDARDVDCPGDGDGPVYAQQPAVVMGEDVFDLDTDDDGEICEVDQPKRSGAATGPEASADAGPSSP